MSAARHLKSAQRTNSPVGKRVFRSLHPTGLLLALLTLEEEAGTDEALEVFEAFSADRGPLVNLVINEVMIRVYALEGDVSREGWLTGWCGR